MVNVTEYIEVDTEELYDIGGAISGAGAELFPHNTVMSMEPAKTGWRYVTFAWRPDLKLIQGEMGFQYEGRLVIFYGRGNCVGVVLALLEKALERLEVTGTLPDGVNGTDNLICFDFGTVPPAAISEPPF